MKALVISKAKTLGMNADVLLHLFVVCFFVRKNSSGEDFELKGKILSLKR